MIRDILLRLRAVFRRDQIERELDEELSLHLEMQTDAYVRTGMDRQSAERRARIELGGVERTKDEYRDALGIGLIEHGARDLRTAFRSLRSTPAATTAALLSLGLAIGANGAVFSIIDGLSLRSLPVDRPEQLALLTDSASAPRARVWNAPIWKEIERCPELFESAAAWSFTRFNLASGGEARFIEGLWVNGTFFEALGVDASLGRVLTASDDVRGGGSSGPTAVISDAYWKRELGGREELIGSIIRLNDVPFTIVGIVEPGFSGPEVGRAFDVIVPLGTEPLVRGANAALDACCTNYLTVMARLAARRSLDAAMAELRAAQPGIRGATLRDWTATASPEAIERHLASPFTLVSATTGFSNLRLRYERPLWVIGVVVALVLAVACVNVANLLTARAIARRHELSGGSRTTQARTHAQLTEGLVVLQVALSIVLVAAAGVFVRSFAGLADRPLGLSPDQVLVATVDAERVVLEPADRLAAMERLQDAVLALPGVTDAALSHRTPLGGGGFTPSVEILAGGGASPTEIIPADQDVFGNLVSSRWFATFGTPVVGGRDFTGSDRPGAPRVAMVNEQFARRFFRGEGPLGQRFTVYPNTPRAMTFEVVGVVADAVYSSPKEAPPATWYAPIAQFDAAGFSFASVRLSVRTDSDSPLSLTEDVARAAAAVEPRLSLTFRALSDQVRSSLLQERLLAQLAAFFGVISLLLSAVGLYGLSAFAVSRRRVEIGVRVALGGVRTRIVLSLVGRMMVLVGLGSIAGLAASTWAARFVVPLVHGLESADPLTLSAAALALLGIGTVAAWIPAQRAVRAGAARAIWGG